MVAVPARSTSTATPASRGRDGLMTIGELSRRGGIPVKALRAYADMGLVYSAGRSPAGYRLFGEPALWCVAVITKLRALGLTIAEIRELAAIYLGQPGEPIGPHVAERLRRARGRADARIRELDDQRQRIDHALAAGGTGLAAEAFPHGDPTRRGLAGSSPGA
jgi:MerR family transcriptional regulator, copper efflux regulator